MSPVDRKVTIKSAALGSPAIDIRRDSEGVLNLSRLLVQSEVKPAVNIAPPTAELNTAANGSSQQSPAPAPWQLQIIDSRIDSGTVDFTDNVPAAAAHFSLQALSLQIANLGTAGATMHVAGDARVNNESRFTLDGDIKGSPLQASLNVDLDSFTLPALQPYLEQQTQLSLKSGLFSLHGHVDYGQPAAPDNASGGNNGLNFAGDASINNLHSADKLTGTEFVDWKLVAVKGIRISTAADTNQLTRVAIASIVAEQAYGNLVIAANQTINVSQILSPPGMQKAGAAPAAANNKTEQPRKPAANASAKPQITIDSINIVDSAGDFTDHSIEPNFSTGIIELNGSVSGLSSQPASRAKLNLQGKVDRFAPVEIEGEMNMLSANQYSDVRMKFSNMELTTFDPYSGKFAGYNISKGKLSADLHYRIIDRKLDAEHHLRIDNLEFGDKTNSKDAAPIPVKLAVALLKDSDGLIELDLPVSGSLDDPQFRFGPLIWRAFMGLLENVATAPFAALGRLFGGGSELEFVEFEPGQVKLNPVESAKLATLAKALVARPTLKLNIPLNTLIAADSTAMAQQRLLALRPTIADNAGKTAQLAALELEYKNRGGQALVYPASEKDAPPATADVLLDTKIQMLEQALLPLLKPNADELAELGRRRADSVQEILLGNTALKPERVFLVNDESTGSKQGKDAVNVKMALKLE